MTSGFGYKVDYAAELPGLDEQIASLAPGGIVDELYQFVASIGMLPLMAGADDALSAVAVASYHSETRGRALAEKLRLTEDELFWVLRKYTGEGDEPLWLSRPCEADWRASYAAGQVAVKRLQALPFLAPDARKRLRAKLMGTAARYRRMLG